MEWIDGLINVNPDSDFYINYPTYPSYATHIAGKYRYHCFLLKATNKQTNGLSLVLSSSLSSSRCFHIYIIQSALFLVSSHPIPSHPLLRLSCFPSFFLQALAVSSLFYISSIPSYFHLADLYHCSLFKLTNGRSWSCIVVVAVVNVVGVLSYIFDSGVLLVSSHPIPAPSHSLTYFHIHLPAFPTFIVFTLPSAAFCQGWMDPR